MRAIHLRTATDAGTTGIGFEAAPLALRSWLRLVGVATRVAEVDPAQFGDHRFHEFGPRRGAVRREPGRGARRMAVTVAG